MSVSVNRIALMGNVGKDPELIQTSNKPFAVFSLATTESFKKPNGEWKDETEWHKVKCFGYASGRVMNQVQKGSLVYVEGKLTSYQNKLGAIRWEVVAYSVQVIKNRKDHQHPSQFLGPEEANTWGN